MGAISAGQPKRPIYSNWIKADKPKLQKVKQCSEVDSDPMLCEVPLYQNVIDQKNYQLSRKKRGELNSSEHLSTRTLYKRALRSFAKDRKLKKLVMHPLQFKPSLAKCIACEPKQALSLGCNLKLKKALYRHPTLKRVGPQLRQKSNAHRVKIKALQVKSQENIKPNFFYPFNKNSGLVKHQFILRCGVHRQSYLDMFNLFLLAKQSIVIHYQPKFNLDNHQVVGFEALLRWRFNDGTLHLPKQLNRVFEHYILATQLSELIQSQVFSNLKSWLDQGIQLVPVSINIVPIEFLKDDFAEKFLERLAYYQIPAQFVQLEITEHHVAYEAQAHMLRALNKLKDNGISIALDDFGTGYSSLSRLRDYPVDCIKIDCGFIQEMLTSPKVAALVRAIIWMGPALDIEIVAEGIETDEQLDMLKQWGCSIGQGYWYSKAISYKKASQILTDRLKA